MRVREVIPFGKSAEEMETREREKKKRKAELWVREGGRWAEGRNNFRSVFIPRYRLFIICILHLSNTGRQLHIAITHCTVPV